MSLFSSLDSEASEDCDEDISDYINSRLVSSPRICDNIRGRDTSDPAAKPGGGLLGSLHGHLVRKAGGCFLYVEGEGGVAARDLPALLLALASEDVTAALPHTAWLHPLHQPAGGALPPEQHGDGGAAAGVGRQCGHRGPGYRWDH